ncbi:MAG: type I-Fv CRISPR-associated protein Cas5fv [Sulfurovum sp.]|nr:type I-Fv CRISPR-associated protein Cas5fv [Sulfurovum sp.]
MKIEIEYEASWRNSFLDGDNNEALPKKGRKFIGSITALKKSENYIKRDVTHNTVMGILNRLIGEQRKLYQAREDENYFFKLIEPLVTFRDDIKVENSELVYLRNMSGNFDPSSFVGSVNINHPLFSSDYSKELWSILDLDLNELIHFVLNENYNEIVKQEEVDPLLFEEKISYFKDIKISNFDDEVLYENMLKALKYLNNDMPINERLRTQFPKVRKLFSEIEYMKNDKLIVRALYCSALYLQAMRLSEKYRMKDIHLKGFSVNGFTPKDFKSLFTGGKKIVYGNPYIAKTFVEGEGQVTSMLTKASGVLEITIDIPRYEAKALKKLIENAGVSSFYLGKKGLAYVTNIDTREVK